jgi:hypothetical protein
MINILLSLSLTLSAALFMAEVSAGQVQNDLLEVADMKVSGEYVRARFLKAMTQTLHPNANKKALIIGDSHAQDFFNSVVENNYLKGYQISTRYIPTRCQIYLGSDREQFIDKKDKALCEKSDTLSTISNDIASADLIILASKWKKWAAEKLPESIKKMKILPQQKLIVIGIKNFGKVSIRKYLRMSDDTLRTLRNEVSHNQQEVNDIMSKNLIDQLFVNTHQLVCGSTSTCPVFTKELKLISFDGGHLTQEGARYFGRILFQGAVLRSLK